MRRTISVALVLAALSVTGALRAQDLTLPLKSGSVRFAVIGDMGTGEQPQYDVARTMAKAVTRNFLFDFVIMLGDNLYGGKSPKDFEKKFAIPYKALLDSGVKFYASLGNHDHGTESYYKPFHMDGQRYYTFKVGDVHFFALDSNYMDPDQINWLTNELKKAGTGWKIPFFHHPLYSSAHAHGSSIELRKVNSSHWLSKGAVQMVSPRPRPRFTSA